MSPPLDLTHSLPLIAPCEHIAGNEKFIKKAFELQGAFLAPDGTSLVDITLDLEDGAPVGEEDRLRKTCADLLASPANRFKQAGVRVHAIHSEHFTIEMEFLAKNCADTIAYITVPKVSGLQDALWAINLWRELCGQHPARDIPFHLLIETPGAVRHVAALAALPQVQVLDFGLMDFISHLGGAIPESCMRSPGQFDHRVLSHTKTAIVLAAVGASKIPSHNVTVEVRDPERAYLDAAQARRDFGFLRMWSIHPTQIEPIIRGMSPAAEEIETAARIIAAAEAAAWGPIELDGRLHDRASYRYYYGLLQRQRRI